MNIPRIIHYCWFGGGKYEHILSQCIKSFKKFGHFKIICWNESNTNIFDNELVRYLVNNKDWAFVSDYVRLKVLYEYGGLYLDTDIQALKIIPDKFYEADMVVGYAYDDIVSTAFIMVKPKHPFIGYLLDMLEGYLKDKRKEVDNGYFTQAFLDYYPNFRLDGKFREFAEGCFIYPRCYFDSATFDRNAGYCIHHGMGSWHNPKNPFKRLLRPIIKLLRFYIKPFGVWYQNRVNKKMVINSGKFLEIYKANEKLIYMNIPHIIHYCWYGDGKMNFILKQCVKSFHKFGCNKIMHWDDRNCNVYDNELLRFLVEKKDWAFVSDYFRLKVLYEHGGIYLDTDVQVIKPLPDEFYEAEMVLGYGFDNLVSTAFIMVKPKHPFIKYIIDIGEGYLKDKQKVINNEYITQGLMDYYTNFKLDGKYREFAKGCFIYPRNYFDSATFSRHAGYCIHHGMVSWLPPRNIIKRALRPTIKLLRFYIRPFGIWYQNWVNKKMLLCNQRFLDIYKKTIELCQ